MNTLVARIASPVWIAGLAIVLAYSPAANAQTAEQPQPIRFDVTAEGFASVQRGTGSELIHGLADQMDRTLLGLAVAATAGADNGFMMSIEGSTTRQVTASAGGRAVGPAVLIDRARVVDRVPQLPAPVPGRTWS